MNARPVAVQFVITLVLDSKTGLSAVMAIDGVTYRPLDGHAQPKAVLRLASRLPSCAVRQVGRYLGFDRSAAN